MNNHTVKMLIISFMLVAPYATSSMTEDHFTTALLEGIRSRSGNLLLSPLSVKVLLGLAMAGSAGDTASQLRQALRITESEKVKPFNEIFYSVKNVTLTVSNGLFIDKELVIKPEYEKKVKKDYQADVNRLDFTRGNEVTEKINSWVAGKMNKKILQIIEGGSLTTETKLVLLNAIYFKGQWAEEFDRKDTEPGIFYLSANETKEIEYMKIYTDLRVYDGDVYQIIELPYEGGEGSMILLKPKKGGLQELALKLLDPNLLKKLLQDGVKTEVILKLPKFKLEHTVQLKEVLQTMGITDLFTPEKANLWLSTEPLYVSQAIQKTIIEINEEGAEAAAASALSIAFRITAEEGPMTITVDCPFAFFIHVRNQTLFVGHVMDPYW